MQFGEGLKLGTVIWKNLSNAGVGNMSDATLAARRRALEPFPLRLTAVAAVIQALTEGEDVRRAASATGAPSSQEGFQNSRVIQWILERFLDRKSVFSKCLVMLGICVDVLPPYFDIVVDPAQDQSDSRSATTKSGPRDSPAHLQELRMLTWALVRNLDLLLTMRFLAHVVPDDPMLKRLSDAHLVEAAEKLGQCLRVAGPALGPGPRPKSAWDWDPKVLLAIQAVAQRCLSLDSSFTKDSSQNHLRRLHSTAVRIMLSIHDGERGRGQLKLDRITPMIWQTT